MVSLDFVTLSHWLQKDRMGSTSAVYCHYLLHTDFLGCHWSKKRLETFLVGMGTGHRKPVQTGLSMAVNQSKTGPPSKWFGFLCMHRVPGGVIKLVSTYILAGLTMSAKRDDQTAISKSLKSGTLPTFTMLRSLLSVEKVPRELVYRNFQELSSSGKFSHAFHCVVAYPRNVINKPFRKP